MRTRPASPRVTIARVVVLTLILGATVLLSWVVVRGPSIFNGPGPFMHPTWLTVWILQAGMAAFVGLVAGWMWTNDMSPARLVAVVLAAWIGELLVLFAIAPILAGELTPLMAPYLWLIATGGVVQPLAVLAGAGVGAIARGSFRGGPHEPRPDVPTPPSHR